LSGEPNALLSLLAHLLGRLSLQGLASVDLFYYDDLVDSALTWVNLSV
jgi:hypothetical protein